MQVDLENWCNLPTQMGTFRMYDTGLEEVTVLSMGDLSQLDHNPILRVHSSCRASEVFGALDCDCADQLRETMKLIATEGKGIIIYQHQEGRGHGLSLKIKAVRTMESDNLDTAESFDKLGLKQDIRCYPEAVEVLRQLGIDSVRLVSNNPRKIDFLNKNGIRTSEVRTHPNVRPENADYLETKNSKLGHKLPLSTLFDSEEPVRFYHSDQPWGEFSNFSRHSIFLENRIWPTVEHFYQAQKFTDIDMQENIRCSPTPMLAKQAAYEMAHSHREDWVVIRENVMLSGLKAKFEQHPDLRKKLLSTGNRYLIEFTDRDEFWGDTGEGSGLNRLGHLLMQVRNESGQHNIECNSLVESE